MLVVRVTENVRAVQSSYYSSCPCFDWDCNMWLCSILSTVRPNPASLSKTFPFRVHGDDDGIDDDFITTSLQQQMMWKRQCDSEEIERKRFVAWCHSIVSSRVLNALTPNTWLFGDAKTHRHPRHTPDTSPVLPVGFSTTFRTLDNLCRLYCTWQHIDR
jgi:hypothetical protein